MKKKKILSITIDKLASEANHVLVEEKLLIYWLCSDGMPTSAFLLVGNNRT